MKIITVGKSDSNDIVLKDPAVSRIHLEIFINDEDKVFVTDKKSVNGTYINGNRITETQIIGKHDVVKAANTIVNWKRFILDSQEIESDLPDEVSHEYIEPPTPIPFSKKRNGIWWLLFPIAAIFAGVLFYFNMDSIKIRGEWKQDQNPEISYSFHSDKTFSYDSVDIHKEGTYSINTDNKVLTLQFHEEDLPAYPYSIVITEGKLEPRGPRTLRNKIPAQTREMAKRYNWKIPRLREIGNVFNVYNKSDYDIKILSISPLLAEYNKRTEQKVSFSKDFRSIESMRFNRNNYKNHLLDGFFSLDSNRFLISEIDNLIIKPQETISLLTTVNKDIFTDQRSIKNRSSWHPDNLITLSDGMLIYRVSRGSRQAKKDKFIPFIGKLVLGDMNPQKKFHYQFIDKQLELNNQSYTKIK